VFEKAKIEKRASELWYPLGKGQAEGYELPARLSFITNKIHQHGLILWYVNSRFRVQILLAIWGCGVKV
jgi:hypothetical protein